jgi:hypothetical protein
LLEPAASPIAHGLLATANLASILSIVAAVVSQQKNASALDVSKWRAITLTELHKLIDLLWGQMDLILGLGARHGNILLNLVIQV